MVNVTLYWLYGYTSVINDVQFIQIGSYMVSNNMIRFKLLRINSRFTITFTINHVFEGQHLCIRTHLKKL